MHDVTDFAAVLTAVGEGLVAAKDQLTRVDKAARGGDVGAAAEAIGRTLIDLAPELARMGPTTGMRRLGVEIGRRASSTFGAPVSTGLIDAAGAAAGLDAPDAQPTDAEVAARLARAVETAIASRGTAGPDGRAILAALGPAADALQVAAESGVTLAEAFSLAMLAALDESEESPEALAVAIAIANAACSLGEQL